MNSELGKKGILFVLDQLQMGSGRVYFGVKPFCEEPEEIKFRKGEWNRVRIVAHGSNLKVYLGEDMIEVSDPTNEFTDGNICLEDGACHTERDSKREIPVRYKNMIIKSLSN